jgi:folate-binding protein YgfZ
MTRSLLRVSGADATEFLQGLVTNDVRRLADGPVYAALLTPQGKYVADFFLIADGDDILIDVAGDLAPGLKQRLSMYKLRADVTITEDADRHLHRGLGGPPADGWSDPRHPEMGWRAWRDTPQEDDPVDWDARRVELLVPETGMELTSDSFILEMNFDALHGVDFRKGCYVGQEVTARMRHKTELRKGLARVRVSGEAEPGAEIEADGRPAGKLLTRAGDTAIAYLRFDRATGEMQCGDATVTREA